MKGKAPTLDLSCTSPELSVLFEQYRSYLEKEAASNRDDENRAGHILRHLNQISYLEGLLAHLPSDPAGKHLGCAEIETEHISQALDHWPPSRSLRRRYSDAAQEKRKRKRRNAILHEALPFFEWARRNGHATHNPINPLRPGNKALTPRAPSLLREIEDFSSTLACLGDAGELKSSTAKLYATYFRIFLYDMERRHAEDPDWPVSVDDLFAEPSYVAGWLKKLENRSPSAGKKGTKIHKSTVTNRLKAIRQVWLHLRNNKRSCDEFWDDLMSALTPYGRIKPLVPGEQRTKEIVPLSPEEVRRLYAISDKSNVSEVLRLRTHAIFKVAFETTMRIASIHSMVIENLHNRENHPEIWECRVRVKRTSANKDKSVSPNPSDPMDVWRDWYMSPGALKAIERYLVATNRSLESTGPLWLCRGAHQLTLSGLSKTMRYWLERSGAKCTNPHVTRHTAISFLINEVKMSVPEVQSISQHENPAVLLSYSKLDQEQAYTAANKALGYFESDDSCQGLAVSVGSVLNSISASVSQRIAQKQGFSQIHLEELLDELRRQIERLTKFLGYETTSDVVTMSSDDINRIEEILGELGLTYESVIGYTPKPQKSTVIRPRGRRPKSLLS